MLRPTGHESKADNMQRTAEMASMLALGLLGQVVPAMQDAASSGISAVQQTDGSYDEEGNWVPYLLCGNPLDSGGCAP